MSGNPSEVEDVDAHAEAGGSSAMPSGQTEAAGSSAMPSGQTEGFIAITSGRSRHFLTTGHNPGHDVNAYQCRLADFMPESLLGREGRRGVFGPNSIAHHELVCDNFYPRMALMVEQVIAKDAINQAVMALGAEPVGSLHQAIELGLRHEVITRAQASYLRQLNGRAN